MSFFSPSEVQSIFKSAGITSWDLRTPLALDMAAVVFQQKLATALSQELGREGAKRSVDADRVYSLLSDLFSAPQARIKESNNEAANSSSLELL